VTACCEDHAMGGLSQHPCEFCGIATGGLAFIVCCDQQKAKLRELLTSLVTMQRELRELNLDSWQLWV